MRAYFYNHNFNGGNLLYIPNTMAFIENENEDFWDMVIEPDRLKDFDNEFRKNGHESIVFEGIEYRLASEVKIDKDIAEKIIDKCFNGALPWLMSINMFNKAKKYVI